MPLLYFESLRCDFYNTVQKLHHKFYYYIIITSSTPEQESFMEEMHLKVNGHQLHRLSLLIHEVQLGWGEEDRGTVLRHTASVIMYSNNKIVEYLQLTL